ncbi:hypothetical protein [Candidatus Spongiisocius sp.]|uniref:hypothetical protein n=1 Tax=Candidatus Spongiisocius sp. TaxID=3101273 RepID=UPI003B5B091E
MYGYMLSFADHDTVKPSTRGGPPHDAFMSDYQKERQRAYDRADHMVRSDGYAHPEVECAKAEAALVRGEAQISRARGGQLAWLKVMLRHHGPARFGYCNPVDLVVSRMDVRRFTARELIYLAQRLDGETIERIRLGAVS